MKGFVLAGTASGVGKTVATLAVCRALEREGYGVQPAKAGPDFIDPSHHEQATGQPSRALDTWLQGEAGVRRNYHRGEGAVCVVEGMMGLYDGSVASTASVASALSLPVVLVVDAKAGMQSVAATALGFREYAARAGIDTEVVGVLAQRAHGGRHERGIREALPEEMTYFGRIPPQAGLEIPDRHLGLEMGSDATLSGETLEAAADCVRTDQLLDVAREPPAPGEQTGTEAVDRTERRVAIAQDAAFCFVYPATVERLREQARVTTFSPVAGDPLPECDAAYLPGGYPELHAEELAGSRALTDLSERAGEGLPVLGECGGLLALAESLTTVDGETHQMAGVLPADIRMYERYQALDHVELEARTGTLTADTGETLRGHEFHYSGATVGSDARFVFEVERGEGIADGLDGLSEHRTLGTYAHVHPASGAFDRLLGAVGRET